MSKPLKQYHYTAAYLLNPTHPITIKVIGCGGTGSQMLSNLARVNASLIALGHPGFDVQAWDPDKVSEANMGRQLFSPSDIDQYKAKILIERINRFYGFAWTAHPMKYDLGWLKGKAFANIIITCVDNADTRLLIGEHVSVRNHDSEFNLPFYWLDLGNTRNTGQVILGTFGVIKKPKHVKKAIQKLSTITEMFPDLAKHEKNSDQGPSCSLAEALTKQDLFINSTLAQYGSNLIWKMFREAKLEYHGVYVNLLNLTSNPIKVK